MPVPALSRTLVAEDAPRRGLVALCITQTTGWGIPYYALPAAVLPISEDTGWDLAFVTGALSAGLLVSAGAGILIGRALDRTGPRALMVTGCRTGSCPWSWWDWPRPCPCSRPLGCSPAPRRPRGPASAGVHRDQGPRNWAVCSVAHCKKVRPGRPLTSSTVGRGVGPASGGLVRISRKNSMSSSGSPSARHCASSCSRLIDDGA
jgi:hypothetical protein